MSHQPIRLCVACRSKKSKKDLLRIVRLPNSHIEFDTRQILPGRGLYVCKASKCLQKLQRKNMIQLTLKRNVAGSLFIRLAQTLRETSSGQLENLIGFAVRSSKAALGITAVEKKIKQDRVRLLIIDSRAGKTTRDRMEKFSLRNKVPLLQYKGDRPLDKMVGKPNCRCLAVLDPNFAKSILDYSTPR